MSETLVIGPKGGEPSEVVNQPSYFELKPLFVIRRRTASEAEISGSFEVIEFDR